MAGEVKRGIWDKRQSETVCAEVHCERIFLKKPHTNRKYCDICSEYRIDKKHRSQKKQVPIVNHGDCCGCGGCLGVESRRK